MQPFKFCGAVLQSPRGSLLTDLVTQLTGGHGMFQIPTMLKSPQNQFRCDFHSSIEKGGMQMHYLEWQQVEAVLERRGCQVDVRFREDQIGEASFGAGSTSEMFFFTKKQVVA